MCRKHASSFADVGCVASSEAKCSFSRMKWNDQVVERSADMHAV